MVVETAVLLVLQRACAELLGLAGGEVAMEVVQRENLIQMSEIVFSGSAFGVFEKVFEGGDRASVIEGPSRIGKRQHQPSSRTRNPEPLFESGERVGNMLEAV